MLRFEYRTELGAAIASLATCAGLLAAPLGAAAGWVAETPHFRVLARSAPGLDQAAVSTAAADLEAIRLGFGEAGLGYPRRADGSVEVLLVPGRADLHALLGDPPGSRTKGITVRGLDRDYAVVPWADPPTPRVTLAHEYAHQLDAPGWPRWFSEGRAIYLARRTEPRPSGNTVDGLVAMLDGSQWTGWPDLIAAERESPVTETDLFPVRSWLLVHWLAGRLPGLAQLTPERAATVLSETSSDDLEVSLLAHLAALREAPPQWLVPLTRAEPAYKARPAQPWEVPLLEAEIRLALQKRDPAEAALADLLGRFPAIARVQAAYATLQLVQGSLDVAAKHFGRALQLGDTRIRTAYRYGVLLMRPGEHQPSRAHEALGHAVAARDSMPHVPMHHLAVVHARMLLEDWSGAFASLGALLRFPGWSERANREAAEIQRRIVQSLRAVPAPAIRPALPEATVPSPPLGELAAWVDRPQRAVRPGARRIWPPPGTWLVHGRIAWVRCAAGEKTVVLHSPYQRIVLRVNPASPPQLINRPFRDPALPCESRGWVAAIAYRRIRGDSEVSGEIVGIRF